MSRNTVNIEANADENFFDKLAREGKLDTFVNLVTSLIASVIIISILICVLCYLSRKQSIKRQMSFNAEVYTDLAVRAEQRVYLMDEAIKHVRKHGYTNKEPTGGSAFSFGVREAGQVTGSMLSSIIKEIPTGKK